MKDDIVRAVYNKTQGHCHFCGDKVVLENYGKKRKPYPDGAWELDHVIQRKKGGASAPDNYLPACRRCNHLRWHRTGEQLREIIFLGLIAKNEIRAKTKLGREIDAKQEQRRAQNRSRRRKSGDAVGDS